MKEISHYLMHWPRRGINLEKKSQMFGNMSRLMCGRVKELVKSRNLKTAISREHVSFAANEIVLFNVFLCNVPPEN